MNAWSFEVKKEWTLGRKVPLSPTRTLADYSSSRIGPGAVSLCGMYVPWTWIAVAISAVEEGDCLGKLLELNDFLGSIMQCP